jgi:uncharacterized protein YihD (DUF1040 family)
MTEYIASDPDVKTVHEMLLGAVRRGEPDVELFELLISIDDEEGLEGALQTLVRDAYSDRR